MGAGLAATAAFPPPGCSLLALCGPKGQAADIYIGIFLTDATIAAHTSSARKASAPKAPRVTTAKLTRIGSVNRVVRLYQLWNWLPHFRAVAETEHLPTASEALRLSPSAISRALKQLEAEVGCELFVRDGRAMHLNDRGKLLLQAVRHSMRTIDDALVTIENNTEKIRYRIAAPGPFHGSLLCELAKTLQTSHPRLNLELCSCPTDEVISRLCLGRVDLVIHEEAVSHPDVESDVLANISKAIACAPDHALATSSSAVTRVRLRAHPFVAPPANARGIREDGWPSHEDRDVRLTVAHMQTGIDAALRGGYLVVLPRPIIAAHALVELSVEDVPLAKSPLFLSRRRQTSLQPKELQALCAEVAALFPTR